MTDVGRISISNALEDTKTEANPLPRANELHSRSLFYEARSCFSTYVLKFAAFGYFIVENPCFLFHFMTDNGCISI